MPIGGYKIRDQQAIHFITFAVVEWVDVFTRQIYAEIVVDSLNYCREHKGLRVHGWCLMSNHIHLIISVKQNFILSDVLRDFKKFTSKKIVRTIRLNQRESRRDWMLKLFEEAGLNNARNNVVQFWRQDNHPIELTSNSWIDQKLAYTHRNPVTAGFVDRAEDFRYSSARDYCGYEGLVKIDFL